MRRTFTVLLGLRDRPRICVRQIQIRFGRYQFGQNPNRASLFVRVKYWEIIADNLSKAGWRCGCISSTDYEGRQFWVVAAEREDAGRFIVRADEKLIGFLELESAIRGHCELA